MKRKEMNLQFTQIKVNRIINVISKELQRHRNTKSNKS